MTPKEEVLLQRVAKILGKETEQLRHIALNDIIEQLVKKIEKRTLWKQYKDISLVSERTFFRRIKMGMKPDKAAFTPPAPTRPYDDKEYK